jgi:hypothetical protein
MSRSDGRRPTGGARECRPVGVGYPRLVGAIASITNGIA